MDPGQLAQTAEALLAERDSVKAAALRQQVADWLREHSPSE